MYDVGVAGLHRLLSNLDTINTADVVIVCAGSITVCLQTYLPKNTYRLILESDKRISVAKMNLHIYMYILYVCM